MENRNATYGHIGNSQGHIHKTVTKFQVAKETSPSKTGFYDKVKRIILLD